MTNRKFSDFMEAKREKICIIMRGLPGSGKSTKINSLLKKHGGDEGHIFSTDDYFIPDTLARRKAGEIVSAKEELEEYRSNWAPRQLGPAHKWNQTQFRAAIDLGMSPVIVDNTNVKPYDFQLYIEYADKAEYTIKFEEPMSPWWLLARPFLKDRKIDPRKLDDLAKQLGMSNTHGVPEKTIRNMMDRWDDNFDVDVLLGKKKPPKDGK